jgi:hypothetical protein
MRVFTYGFDTKVRHIRELRPKIIIVAELVADMELHFSGLHAHLSWILFFKPWSVTL